MVIRIMFVFLLLGLFVNPAVSDTVKGTGVELLRDCKVVVNSMEDKSKFNLEKDLNSYLNCVGYLSGVIDILGLYGPASREVGCHSPSAFICLPTKGISVGQAVRIVIKYLEETPEELHRVKRVLVHNALRKAFPCDKVIQ
jgi:hypothetical protein